MHSFIELYPATALGFCLLVALCIGSFLNVVIHRLPIMLQRQWRDECRVFLADELKASESTEPGVYNLMLPRSACPHCGSLIKAWQNIPVISWLALRGKCANCKSPISIRYPLVEMATALLTLACWWQFGFTLSFIFSNLFCIILLCLSLIDLDSMLLPDQLTLPTLWLGLLLNINASFVPLSDAVIGAALGYSLLWALYWLFKLLTGKEGMGYGDFKLLAMIGAWFGWQALPLTILLSSFAGALIGISLIALGKRQQSQAIPFGPYLALGGVVYLFFGAQLHSWYFSYLGLS
ncbi:prepilin peptidase [Agarivorans gilvus]|uniref:Prepilin leader peptidase/N-methyltransferase n=2 Tax=Agarivorans TaxID=261825 RepID=A0ABQ1HYW4_9ALTE|nr:A24 family peptidase [Agarivorans gilvus]GGA96664.1 type 4 prepilin-like proteins leader peptide-processing enzyme [Agarivorans gilvus]